MASWNPGRDSQHVPLRLPLGDAPRAPRRHPYCGRTVVLCNRDNSSHSSRTCPSACASAATEMNDDRVDLRLNDHVATIVGNATMIEASCQQGAQRPPSWHRLGPLHVPLEAMRCRHRAVAISIVSVASLVTGGR